MSTDGAGPVSTPMYAQIRSIVSNLSKKSYKASTAELKELAKLHGDDARLFLLYCLLEEIDFQDKSQRDSVKTNLFTQELGDLATQPNFTSIICRALQANGLANEFFTHFVKASKLSFPQQLLISLGLAQSVDSNVREEGLKFLKGKMADLREFSNEKLPENVVHQLLFFLRESDAFTPEQKTQFIRSFAQLHPEILSSLSLAPLLREPGEEGADSKQAGSSEAPDGIINAIASSTGKPCDIVQLCALLQDLGFSAFDDRAQLTQVLSEFPNLTPRNVAEVLAALVLSPSSTSNDDDPTLPLASVLAMAVSLSQSSGFDDARLKEWQNYTEGRKEGKAPSKRWNVEVFVETMRELQPKLDWMEVFQNFDLPQFKVTSADGFGLLLQVFTLATRGSALPISIMLKVWKNKQGQLSLIRFAAAAPSHIFSFANAPRLLKGEAMEGGQPDAYAWVSLDLLDSLFALANSDNYFDVRTLLQGLCERMPDLLLPAVLQVAPPARAGADKVHTAATLKEELVASLSPSVLRSASPVVMQRVWESDQKHAMGAMLELAVENSDYLNNVVRFLDANKEGNKDAFGALASSWPVPVALRLAALASRKEGILDLDQWLQQGVKDNEAEFVPACLEYITEAAKDLPTQPAQPPQEGEPPRAPTVVDTLAVMFKSLASVQQSMSEGNAAALREKVAAVSASTPQLAALKASVEDIEEEANSYFQKIYTQQLTLEEVVLMLKRFESSSEKREREVYACMIHNLFDEYRFFHKYPIKELRITGILFGLLIQDELVPSYTLGIALRYVLEALRKKDDSKMFRFGMWALSQFKNRLHEWPQYCLLIVQLPHIRANHRDLAAYLDNIIAQAGDIVQVSGPGTSGTDGMPNMNTPDFPGAADESQQRAEPIPGSVEQGQPAPSATTQPAQTTAAAAPQHNSSSLGQSESLAKPTLTHSSTAPVPQQPQQPQPQQQQQPQQPQVEFKAAPSSGPAAPGSIALGRTTSTPAALSGSAKPAAKPPVSKPSPVISSQGFGTAINIETLLSAEQNLPVPALPSEQIVDKIHFTINNVSAQNLPQKAKEMRAVLVQEHYQYFSRYLVTKRVSIEANFHALYSQFLDVLGIAPLNKVMVDTTYECVKVLLNSEKILTSSNERILLKNLGSWLGLLTIAKNKPLLAKKLSLKTLIMEAYSAGRLIAAVPFAAKVLEACKKSKVFKPPNPWLMARVSLLKEIFELPDVKLNLKFEVEVLFNNLQIKMSEIKATELLKGLPKFAEPAGTTSPALSSASGTSMEMKGLSRSTSTPSMMTPGAGDMAHLHLNRQQGMGGDAAAQENAVENGQSIVDPNADASRAGSSTFGTEQYIIPNLPAYITVSSEITLFNMYPHLKRCVPTAIDRAIREIITPVVERSVTIACVTTRELVLKDFAMEPDETKMRKASHQMVRNLTSSLALVTCKEPLRVSITNHLGALLEANCNAIERPLMEFANMKVSEDNIELGCTIIEKAASDRATREIDEALGHALQVRRKHREQTGQPYYDMSIFVNGRFPSSLPEPLRPKPGGLSSMQLQVYDEFAHIPTHQPDSYRGQQLPQGQQAQSATGKASGAPVAGMPGMPGGAKPAANSEVSLLGPAGSAAVGTAPQHTASGPQPAPSLASTQALEKLMSCMNSCEQAVGRVLNHKSTSLSQLPALASRVDHEVNHLLRMVPVLLNQCPRDDPNYPVSSLWLMFSTKVFARVCENRQSQLHLEVSMQILKYICSVCPKLSKELTVWLLAADDETKNLITVPLLKARLLHVPDLDVHLAKQLVHAVHTAPAREQAFLDFLSLLVRRVVVKEPILTVQDLPHVFDQPSKLLSVAQQRRHKPSTDVLMLLMEVVRNAPAPAAGMAPEQPQQQPAQTVGPAPTVEAGEVGVGAVSTEDPNAWLNQEELQLDADTWDVNDEAPEFRAAIASLYEQWVRICLRQPNDKTYANYLGTLQQQRVLSTPESAQSFFLIIMQLCMDNTYTWDGDKKEPSKPKAGDAKAPGPQLSYTAIDAVAKLVVFLVKFFQPREAGAGGKPDQEAQIKLFNSFLRAACRVLRRDFDNCARTNQVFNQRPYFRLFSNLLAHLNTPDPSLDSNNKDVLIAFGQCFRLLRPARVPSFCFAWLELISHRMFMSKLLISKGSKCAVMFERLLVDLLQFMQPYLRNAELTDSVRLLYKGTLRLLLVLLHDFPEFLCEFHFSFCDVIPPTCVQMRNLILSAFPRNMRLPDPFTPNLKVDLLPDIAQPPRILSDVTTQLAMCRPKLMEPLNAYLAKRAPASLLSQIHASLVYTNPAQIKAAGTKYNVPLLNSLVLYVGCQGIAKLQSKSGMAQFQDNACMDVFEGLVASLEPEGRYYVLNAVANQLRYPNNHTHYFSCVLLYIFLQCKQVVIMEQITRVLLERLIVHRPHPWGLLITFIELIKNPRYGFWKQSFTRCAPEIERLFESVARSCMYPSKPAGGMDQQHGQAGGAAGQPSAAGIGPAQPIHDAAGESLAQNVK